MKRILDYTGEVDIRSGDDWEPILLNDNRGSARWLSDHLLRELHSDQCEHEKKANDWQGRLHILVELVEEGE